MMKSATQQMLNRFAGAGFIKREPEKLRDLEKLGISPLQGVDYERHH